MGGKWTAVDEALLNLAVAAEKEGEKVDFGMCDPDVFMGALASVFAHGFREGASASLGGLRNLAGLFPEPIPEETLAFLREDAALLGQSALKTVLKDRASRESFLTLARIAFLESVKNAEQVKE